jgi:hypothetical protein
MNKLIYKTIQSVPVPGNNHTWVDKTEMSVTKFSPTSVSKQTTQWDFWIDVTFMRWQFL